MNNILRGQQIARRFTHGSRRPDVVRLQKYVEADYPNAIAAGFVNCSFSEYEQRLAGVIAGFEQQGIVAKTVTMTVADILATLSQHGIPNTPDGRAQAIGLFRASHSGGKTC